MLLESLVSMMKNHGFICPSPKLDGQYHRFPRGKSPDAGWIIGSIIDGPIGPIATASFGDWISGEKYFWRSDSEVTYTEEQASAIQEQMNQAAEAAERAKREQQLQAQVDAHSLLFAADSIQIPAHSYLTKKGFSANADNFGARFRKEDNATLVRAEAFTDLDGNVEFVDGGPTIRYPVLYGVQKILPTGEKKFLPGMRIKGCFHKMGGPQFRSGFDGLIILCEGFATGATLQAAFPDNIVLSCFNAGNLEPVARDIRKAFPSASICVAADEDVLTKRPNGEFFNAGRVYGTQAAQAVGGKIVFPEFSREETLAKNTDFNDLHSLLAKTHGESALSYLRKMIENQLQDRPAAEPVHFRPVETLPQESGAGVPTEPTQNPFNLAGISTLIRTKDEKGKPIRPAQQAVARALLEHYGNALVKCNSDVFRYTGTHWVLCEDKEHDLFFRQLQKLAGFDFKAGEIEACLKIFLKGIAHVPSGVNLFEPRPDRANFLNGTLHLSFSLKTPAEMAQNPGANPYFFSMEFKPHDRADYCTTVIPMEYKDEELLPENPELIPALKRVWPDSPPEQQAKIQLYEELLGAALTPLFSKIVFFQGDPQTGKSTLLMLFGKLVGKDNLASVDPTKFGESFHLEPMMNKLVNMDPDISTSGRIDDAFVKKIVDRPLLPINRKGKKIVYARLPGLHAFGCNDLPRSIENSRGVYNRRVIIVKTDTKQAGSGGGGEFSEWLWGQGPQGVLKAALRGLKRLLANGGQYTVPESSTTALEAWALENDLVAQFLEAVKHQEVRPGNQIILVGTGREIERSKLYEAFLEWAKASAPGLYVDKVHTFSKKLVKAGFETKKVEGVRKWIGIGTVESPSGQF